MRLRLTRFDHLRLALAPGWYELPSHVEADEVRRLLDLLADALPGVEDILECEWSDLDSDLDWDLGLNLQTSTLAFIAVPKDIERASIEARLSSIPVRVGLYQHRGTGRWPEVAWDEIEVKSVLVATLRKSLRKPNHPLAPLGIAELPVDVLAEATSEPIELLVLAESTIEFAIRQHDEGQAIDWLSCARWSIGRRLANRLASAARELRSAVRDAIAQSRDGTLSTLYHPREVDELVRLGLAHSEEGDALLVPLARLATEQGVVEILDLEGVTTPEPVELAPTRDRAMSPTEAIVAFDPVLPVMPSDPWFVDLRALVPEIQDFGRRFHQQLARRDRNVQLAILQQPGSGGSTMIHQLLHDLAASGIVSIAVRTPAHAGFGFVDLLLRAMSAILAYCEEHWDQHSTLSIPKPVLSELRAWLAEHCLEGELREYVRLGADIMEHARIPSLLMILQRVLDRTGADSPERTRIRLALDARTDEILAFLGRIIDGLRSQLIVRGQQLCLHHETSEHLDPNAVDEVFVAHVEDLRRLDCHMVFSVGLATEYLPLQRPVSAVFTTLSYPALASNPEGLRAAVRALLAARADLDRVFERPDEMVALLAKRSQGSLRRSLELAKRACEQTVSGLVAVEAIEPADGAVADVTLVLADEWPIINAELTRREQAGEDGQALRRMIAEPRHIARDLRAFDLLAGRYRLLEIAGKGAFATVWRAWDREERCTVALKVLDSQWSTNPKWRERLFPGLEQIAALKHPGIVPVLRAHGEDAGHHFHVMKWMAHGSLALAIEEGRISPFVALRSLATIGEALDVVHSEGLLHRDVGPHWIMLDEQDRAALTGFEIARVFDAQFEEKYIAGLGTTVYAAPEQLMAASDIGSRADVYGLGMTALFCMLGRPPPPLVARTEPAILESLACSPELARAIVKAVAYDQAERAPDCSGLASALRAPTLRGLLTHLRSKWGRG
jgi:hypothetical protein